MGCSSQQVTANQTDTRKPLILVVEDNDRNARLVKEILVANHYEVVEASDGKEALEAVRLVRPDLILMDLQLPDMDGLSVTQRIKADPETAEIPIIALTAHAMDEHRSHAREAGCCCFISKPISYQNFLEKVKNVIAASLRCDSH